MPDVNERPVCQTWECDHLHAQSVRGLKKCHGLRFQYRQAVRQEHRRYGRYSRHRINFFDTPPLTTPSGPFESPRSQGPVFFQMTLVAFLILVSYTQTACHHFMHWDSEQMRKSIAQNQRIRCGSFHRLLNKIHYIRFPSRSNLKDCGGFNICLPLPRMVGCKLPHLEKDNSPQRLKPKSHCWE